jgi:hypothetical protein
MWWPGRKKEELQGNHAVGPDAQTADPTAVAAEPDPAEDRALAVGQHTPVRPDENVPTAFNERKHDDMTTPGTQHDRVALAEPDREVTAIVTEPEAIPATPTPVIPAPVVLLGNPRLGSDPAGYPRAWGSAPDSVLDGAQFAGLTIRAASLRGDDHRFAAESRQDSIGLWALDASGVLGPDRVVLLACVADGVGEHELSHLGSARACSLLGQHVEAHLAGLVDQDRHVRAATCERVIAEVASGLRVFAAESRLEPKAVSTTLSACLVIPERPDSEGAAARALLFNVGDSAGFLLRERNWLPIPKREMDDDVLSTGTDALPTRPDRCEVTASALYAGDMIMVCTDGLGKPLENIPAVREQLADWWDRQVPSLPEFYWQMSFRAQTYGDDRSAACIWINARP